MLSTPGKAVATIGGAFVALLLVVFGFNWLLAFHAVGPSDVCVVQHKGFWRDRSVGDIRQPGSGVGNIGAFNKQFCFPATQRNYIITSNPNAGDQKGVDFVEVPTKDAVNVRVEGQALFTLNTDPVAIKSFYLKYGVRTFDGSHPYDGNTGWESFLDQNFRPVLDNALREALGGFNCDELNNTCQYVTSAQQAVKGNVKAKDTGQNIAAAQGSIESTLRSDLNDTLQAPAGHPYFTNIRFRLRYIKFSPAIQNEIDTAVAARTQVATAQLQGQQRVAAASADRRVAEQKALAIKATRSAYATNPIQGRIDTVKALCGSDGCPIQSLGGQASLLLQSGK